MSTHDIIFAGFGGQGLLFSGKLIASAGMVAGKEVSWLPSYGPEMRGGTANCHVIVSDEPVASPIVVEPTSLIAMNRPSLDKFEDYVVKDGILMMDSSLIDRKAKRKDVNVIEVPATKIASDIGNTKLANMILVGKWIKESGALSLEIVETALDKAVSARKKDLIEANIKAIEKGYNL